MGDPLCTEARLHAVEEALGLVAECLVALAKPQPHDWPTAALVLRLQRTAAEIRRLTRAEEEEKEIYDGHSDRDRDGGAGTPP